MQMHICLSNRLNNDLQVYKATLNVPEFERVTGRKIEALKGKKEVDIAIKVSIS